MANGFKLTFKKEAFIERVRDGTERALASAGEFGHSYWDAIAPIGRDPRPHATLRESWFHHVHADGGRYTLVMGASARHSIFIEIGTSHMPPQAPLRTTAGEVVAILPDLLSQELSE